jgi:hypothetical protein
MGPRRRLSVLVFLAIFGAIVFVARVNHHEGYWIYPGAIKDKDSEPTPCIGDLGWLEPYQFSYPIQYAARDIITAPAATTDRPSLTVVNQPLFGEYITVDLAQDKTVTIPQCLQPLTLEVPHGTLSPADASHMIFGLQTTMKRLKDTVKHLARWLPNTNARLIAVVVESEELPADDAEMKQLEKEFRDLAMNVTLIHPVRPDDTFAQRYFSLVSIMYAARNAKTQWITLIDDDTFFPSMHDLVAMLAKHDSGKPQYIGSLSEGWGSVNHYGLMGFGGAGIMLSIPMAKIIDDQGDDCKEHLRTTAGDVSVMDCIYRFSSTKLTHVPSLHQVDMHGDLSGFYESGREMMSLHHWKEGSAAGYKLEMEKMHLVADICGNCFLMRWQFPHDLVLTNGFSINYYPQGQATGRAPGILGTAVDKINLEQMEQTWSDDIIIFHSLAPTREKMPEETKVGYKLLDSMIVHSDVGNFKTKDTVRQIYFKEGMEREGGEKEMDTVMVLNWRAGPEMGLQTGEAKSESWAGADV